MLNPIGERLQSEFNPARVTSRYHSPKTESGRTLVDRKTANEPP
jgi:hypothetical protein